MFFIFYFKVPLVDAVPVVDVSGGGVVVVAVVVGEV